MYETSPGAFQSALKPARGRPLLFADNKLEKTGSSAALGRRNPRFFRLRSLLSLTVRSLFPGCFALILRAIKINHRDRAIPIQLCRNDTL